MRLSARKWRWIGLGLAVVAIAFIVVRTWVVPAVILGQIQAKYRGRVVVRDWWFGLHSAGLVGVSLGEGPEADSPEWLSVDRIAVDVSLASLIRGRVSPTRVEIDHPRIKFRMDAKGQPITKIPLAPQDPKTPASPLPEIDAHDGELTLEQAGRKPMTIAHVEVRLRDGEDKESLEVTTDDPTWGKVTINGHFDETFKNGELRIASSPGFVADPEKLERIPFIPAEVWSNIEPSGPVDAIVKITLAADSPKPVRVYTDISLKGTTAKLATLQIQATEATGHVIVDDAMVKVQDVKGKAVDGSIAASGMLDFSKPIPRFDLDLRLKGIDVTKAPASWQLNELQATGRLSGKVDLIVSLPPGGPDLTGTNGEAVIEQGSFQGIPIKSLSVGLTAEGGDLQYATLAPGSVRKDEVERDPTAPVPGRAIAIGLRKHAPKSAAPGVVDVFRPLVAVLPLIRLATHDEGVLGWSAYIASEFVGVQDKQPTPKAGGFKLPKTVSTRIELEDVDLVTILAKADKFGIKIPVPIAGRLSIKAAATIPIGSYKDIKGYTFRGDATLSAASIDHVDFGLISAHLDLVDGVLDLSDFRGQLIDKPSGDDKNPPHPTTVPPKAGPLPRGAFRGFLKASISPKGPLMAKFEGVQLPLGELFAPFLPVPTPLSGELTLNIEARADVADLSNPMGWKLDGRAQSHRIKYRGAVLDEISTAVHLKDDRLEIAEFTARLAGHPLSGQGGLNLAAPYAYDGRISIAGWEIADVLAFVPGLPRPAPASGVIDARGEASGTLQPFAIQTLGAARILKARAGPAPLGNVAFHWTTDREFVALTGLEFHPFGGKVTGEARIPTKPGPPLHASMSLKGIDAARLSAAFLGDSLSIAGRADGRVKVVMPIDGSIIDADADLVAPEMTVREGKAGDGIRVGSLNLKARARKGVLHYEATAQGLGGHVRFQGTAPATADIARATTNAQFQATNVRLNPAWRGLGISGGLAQLDGYASVDTNLRASISPFRLWTHGNIELTGLHYGRHLDLGNLRGQVATTPTTWRIEELHGDLLGGVAIGSASGATSKPDAPKKIAFDFKVDRASLHRMLSSVPMLAHGAEGHGSLRVSGQLHESLRATAELSVPRAKVLGLPISDLRFPGEIELSPSSGIGSFRSRHWVARVAGGSARGNVFMRLGEERSFQTEVNFTDVDLETLSRSHSLGKGASGKVSGKISLSGHDPSHVGKMRGKVAIDLDDASLVSLPIVKEFDRFLGGAKGGGLFEDGDLQGTIYNGTLFIEQLTLQGKLVQVHATGAVTLGGALNLEVLVNTNQIIPQTGLAVVSLVPGLGQILGRGEEAIMHLATFFENKLLQFRVTGTLDNPTVQLDPGVSVGQGAAGFFAGALKVPVGSSR